MRTGKSYWRNDFLRPGMSETLGHAILEKRFAAPTVAESSTFAAGAWSNR